MRSVLSILFLAGCGRMGFSDTTIDATTADDGEVLVTTDGMVQASAWQMAPVQGPTETLWSLEPLSSTDIWVAGTNGYIGHFNGSVWSLVASGTPVTLYMLWPSSTNLWVVGQACTLLRYTTGVSWQPIVAQGCTGNKALNAIDGTGPGISNMWVVGEQGTILQFNGMTWTDRSQGNLSYWDIDVASTSEALIAGTVGTILRWNGSQMVNEMGAPSVTLAAFEKIDQDTWLVGSQGTILRKTGAGSWMPVSSPVTTGTLYDIHAVTANDIWAVGTGGVILHYDGNAWSQAQSPTTKTLRNVAGIPGGGMIAVGDSGVVLIHP